MTTIEIEGRNAPAHVEEAPRKRRLPPPRSMPRIAVAPYQWAIRAVLWDGQPHSFGEILAQASPHIEAGVASRAYLQRTQHKDKALTVAEEKKLNVSKAVRQGRQRMVYNYLHGMTRFSRVVKVVAPRTRATGIMADTYQWAEAPGPKGIPLPPQPPQYNLADDEEGARQIILSPTPTAAVPAAPVVTGVVGADRLASLEREIEHGLRMYHVIGARLRIMRDEKLYLYAGYDTFAAYCEQRWGTSLIHANRLMRAAAVTQVLSDLNANKDSTPVSLVHAVTLYPLIKRPYALSLAWRRAVEEAPGARPTRHQIAAIVNEMVNPVKEVLTAPAPPEVPEGGYTQQEMENILKGPDAPIVLTGSQAEALHAEPLVDAEFSRTAEHITSGRFDEYLPAIYDLLRERLNKLSS